MDATITESSETPLAKAKRTLAEAEHAVRYERAQLADIHVRDRQAAQEAQRSPVIITTAETSYQARPVTTVAAEYGVIATLLKPFDLSEFASSGSDSATTLHVAERQATQKHPPIARHRAGFELLHPLENAIVEFRQVRACRLEEVGRRHSRY
jgi:hypothetical protein